MGHQTVVAPTQDDACKELEKVVHGKKEEKIKLIADVINKQEEIAAKIRRHCGEVLAKSLLDCLPVNAKALKSRSFASRNDDG